MGLRLFAMGSLQGAFDFEDILLRELAHPKYLSANYHHVMSAMKSTFLALVGSAFASCVDSNL